MMTEQRGTLTQQKDDDRARGRERHSSRTVTEHGKRRQSKGDDDRAGR